jgi:cephalosporin hydroxylase
LSEDITTGKDKRIEIDFERQEVTIEGEHGRDTYGLATPQAFDALSRAWLRGGWDNKYVYSFSWMGRPIIQLPDDLVRLQEVIYSVKPDLIIETGVAHGGSLIFYASLLKAMERGRVIGIDIEIRPHNRLAIEQHELFPLISLIEGSSVDPLVVDDVRSRIGAAETVMVFLDSDHSKQHVLAELNAYGSLVTKGSYIVAMDGIMKEIVGAPRTNPDWSWNNPISAAREFVQNNPGFVIEEPPFGFNEGSITKRVTYWPCGFIRRVA